MIYKYDETAKKIERWLEFKSDEHNRKKQYFDPDRSIKNTLTWKKNKCDLMEIRYIENELKEYLYDFPEN